MENLAKDNIPATTSTHDSALNKQELRHIYDNVVSPHLFEAWYADLDPWNRGMIFASHFKNYLSSIGFNKWDEINRMMPGLEMEKVDEVPKAFPNLREEADQS
jgi:hypothetical protein